MPRPVVDSCPALAARLLLAGVLFAAARTPAQDSPTGASPTPSPAHLTAIATAGPPTATRTASPTRTETATPSPTGTATPTLARPSDPVGLVIYDVIVAGTHPWFPASAVSRITAPLRRLYERDGLAPLWVRDGKPTAQAHAMIAAFDTADARGLASAGYDPARLRDAAQRLAQPAAANAEEIGLFDTALSIETLRYVSDTYLGRVDPSAVDFPFDRPRRAFDPAVATREIADGVDPVARLAELDPPFPQFGHLRDALQRYRALAARTDVPAVPRLPKLRPGDTDPGVPALRTHLAALGDLPADAPAPARPDHYDAALVKAVRHYQERHGLAADGVVGATTLQALRVPVGDRVEQIELAMERMRWLPYAWPSRFIVVNIPEFRLRAYGSGAGTQPLEMNVVVGEAELARKHKTPLLMADMRYLVFRPYWMVPPSIIKKELAPKIARDPEYLARNSMEVVNGRIRQRPGTSNSLGLVKFILPNPFHVYLHDTPSKGLFARSRRDFSHGCIRIADPPALAEFVLAGTPGWDRVRINHAMRAGPDNHHVPLASPIPVFILYATAVADESGEVHFFDDIYGHDAVLRQQLAAASAH